jgi:hypothetical protein
MPVAGETKRPAELALGGPGYGEFGFDSATVERRDQIEQAAEQRGLEAFHVEIAGGHPGDVAQVQTNFFLTTRRGEIMRSRDGLAHGSVGLCMSLRLGSSGRSGRGSATNLVLGGTGCAHQILHKTRDHKEPLATLVQAHGHACEANHVRMGLCVMQLLMSRACRNPPTFLALARSRDLQNVFAQL